jgi:hypothetical protein
LTLVQFSIAEPDGCEAAGGIDGPDEIQQLAT